MKSDKVIIGGIDVSKCSNYFKQLARAKEEIEKLKSQQNNDQKEDDRGYCETYDCKYYDNFEECQKQNCWYKCYSKEYAKNVQLKKELKAKEQECEELKKDCPKRCKSDKYKQALDEIEHILETYSDDDWKATREIENIISKAKEQ